MPACGPNPAADWAARLVEVWLVTAALSCGHEVRPGANGEE